MSAITPFRRVLLDLVARFCYDGMERTKLATWSVIGDRIPVFLPLDIPDIRFRCDGGVPEPYLAACINSVHDTDLMLKLWGETYPNWNTDLRYLTERGLLERYETTFFPTSFVFNDPFVGTEILSEIVRDLTVPPPSQIRWRFSNLIDQPLDAKFRTLGNLTFFKLTPMGHELREPLELRGPKTGTEPMNRQKSPASPAWERLVIVKSDTGNDLARLGAKEHRLTGANDAKFLELLKQKRGTPILGSTLETECGERPARIYARLPNAIQRIIDKPGQRTGKKGYRML